MLSYFMTFLSLLFVTNLNQKIHIPENIRGIFCKHMTIFANAFPTSIVEVAITERKCK